MTVYRGRIQLLAKPASEWGSADPVLLNGEVGVSDPGTSAPVLKVGDGVRNFSVLPPITGGGGASANYVVGTTTTLSPGSFATVTIDNAASPPTISFGIPTGAAGPANTLAIGTTTTGAPGSPASATITGTPPAQTLNLVLPQGATGPAGSAGADGASGPTGATGPANSLTIGTVTTGAAGSPAAATITGTPPTQVLNLTIPKGADGAGLTMVAPTGVIGLTMVPGVATTTSPSDSSPALSQAIAPTWTGLHTFAADVTLASATPRLILVESDQASGERAWPITVNGKVLGLRASDDAGSGTRDILTATRGTGAAITVVALGNATDNPAFSLLGSGVASVSGSIVVGAATGGSLGVGTINATAVYDDGVQLTNATAASPSASVGLAAVNGAAITFMRSDAAPALSQAIAPTWSALHTFSLTPLVPDNSWPYAKLQDVSASSRVLGRITAGAGDIEELTGANLQTILGGAIPGAANPTASVGLAAVNGAAITFMRSDAAPALSQAIAPTWTAAHIFSASVDLAGPLKASAVEGVSGQVLSSQGPGLAAIWRTASGGSIELGYNFNTSTAAANPGSQKLAYNNATFAGTTAIYFNITAFTNFDASTILSLLQAGNRIYMQQRNDASKACVYQVTGPGTNNTGWWSIPVTLIDSRGTPFPNNADLNCVFILSVSASASANPTAVVGLAAVNGSATTWMRSDAAPPLSQAITPSWTGLHTFTSTAAVAGGAWQIVNSSPTFVLWDMSQAANSRAWYTQAAGANYTLGIIDDGSSIAKNVFKFARAGTALTSMAFGNAADNPPYSFLGTGAATFGGTISAARVVYVIDGAVTAKLQSAGTALVALVGTESNHDFAVYTNNTLRSTYAANGSTITNTPVLLGPNGSAGAPTYSFSGDPDTGIAVGAANQLALIAGGGTKLVIEPTLIWANNVPIGIADGNAAAPGLAFGVDLDTGILRYTANGIAISTGGVIQAYITTDATQWQGQMRGADGSAGSPQYSFTNETTLGFWRSAAATIACTGTLQGPAFNTTSARAVKRETGAPLHASDILARLRPIFYRLLADDSREQLGLVAEEVHDLCPQLSDGKTVSYDRLALLLLADWQDRHLAAA